MIRRPPSSAPGETQPFVLAVRVQPRASREEVAGIAEGAVRIRLTAPPVEGKANEALVRFLAKAFGVQKGNLELVSGDQGRSKLLRVTGIGREEAYARLGVEPPPG